MARAINPHKIHEFYLPREAHLPEGERSCFRLRALTQAELASITDDGLSFEGGKVRIKVSTQASVRAADLALVGWARFYGEDGKEVPFPAAPADKRPVDWLLQADAIAMGTYAVGMNKLTEADLGKSRLASG